MTLVDVLIVYAINVINREVHLPVTGMVVMVLVLFAGSGGAYETAKPAPRALMFTGGSSLLSLLIVAAVLMVGSHTRLHTTTCVAAILAVGAIVSFTPGLCSIFGLG